MTEEEEQLIARQFKTECDTGELNGSMNEEQFTACLLLWNVPRTFISMLFRAYDRYLNSVLCDMHFSPYLVFRPCV